MIKKQRLREDRKWLDLHSCQFKTNHVAHVPLEDYATHDVRSVMVLKWHAIWSLRAVTGGISNGVAKDVNGDH